MGMFNLLPEWFLLLVIHFGFFTFTLCVYYHKTEHETIISRFEHRNTLNKLKTLDNLEKYESYYFGFGAHDVSFLSHIEMFYWPYNILSDPFTT